MGRRGPKRTPTPILVARDSWRGRQRQRRGEPRLPAGTPRVMRAPGHLSAEAKREWRRLAAVLSRHGILTVGDRAVFATYCSAWGRLVAAERKLAEHGAVSETPNGLAVKSVYLCMVDKATQQVAALADRLGLTPAARCALTHESPLAEPDRGGGNVRLSQYA